MDLSTIKRNIEIGNIRTTAEFQRDVMLMFMNALMYNERDHHVYKMAKEMQADSLDHFQVGFHLLKKKIIFFNPVVCDLIKIGNFHRCC